MKVAYNNCFGGFGLSHEATIEYAKIKGITLTAYNQTKYKHSGGVDEYAKTSNPTGMFVSYLTKDIGSTVDELPEDLYYYKSFHDDESRCDLDLIEIIERLGDKANGICASLAIEEIPDGASFEIIEYDGNESVVPPRQSW